MEKVLFSGPVMSPPYVSGSNANQRESVSDSLGIELINQMSSNRDLV